MMAAKCQRFYQAGDPLIWLKMPLDRLAFFVAEIEPLQASEQLRMINALRLSRATKKDQDSIFKVRELEIKTERRHLIDTEAVKERRKRKRMSKAEWEAGVNVMGFRTGEQSG